MAFILITGRTIYFFSNIPRLYVSILDRSVKWFTILGVYMNFIDNAALLLQSKEFKNNSKDFTKKLISASTGDIVATAEALHFILKSPMFFREQLFWEKFSMFLNGVFIGEEDKLKLSEIFADNEEKEEYSRRIIKVIDDIDSLEKTKIIINLTRSLLLEFINKSDYYRLINVVKLTMIEDLKYLNRNIRKTNLKNDIHIQFLEQNNLVIQTVISGGDFNNASDDNEYEFTQLAHMLDKFGLDYSNEEKYKYSEPINSLSSESIQRSKIINVGAKFL